MCFYVVYGDFPSFVSQDRNHVVYFMQLYMEHEIRVATFHSEETALIFVNTRVFYKMVTGDVDLQKFANVNERLVSSSLDVVDSHKLSVDDSNRCSILAALSLLRAGIKTERFPVEMGGSAPMWMYVKYELGKDLDWFPNDVDVYICSPKIEDYTKVITDFKDYMIRRYIAFVEKGTRDNMYSDRPFPLKITDFQVHGIVCKLSFIWDREANTISDVLDTYDLDIVQVGFDFKHLTFTVGKESVLALENGMATVNNPFCFLRSNPTNREIAILGSTLRRMQKYSRRGFIFCNFPILHCYHYEKDDLLLFNTTHDEEEELQPLDVSHDEED